MSNPTESALKLRSRAEKKLGPGISKPNTELSFDEMQRMVHELEVHQIELEMQNAELLNTQNALEIMRNKYAEIYDFAPISYFILNVQGVIKEVNFKGTSLLGIDKHMLTNTPFVNYIADADGIDIFNSHLENVLQKQGQQKCVIKFRAKDGTIIYGLLKSVALDERGNKEDSYILCTIIDLTINKLLEQSLQQANYILESKVKERTEELSTKVAELSQALDQIKTLHGIVPICMHCKKIRDDNGYWNQVEVYIREHTEAELSHGICPECLEKLYTIHENCRSCK